MLNDSVIVLGPHELTNLLCVSIAFDSKKNWLSRFLNLVPKIKIMRVLSMMYMLSLVGIRIILTKLQKQLMLTVINNVACSYFTSSMKNECETLCRIGVVFILSKILACPDLNDLNFSMHILKKLHYIYFFFFQGNWNKNLEGKLSWLYSFTAFVAWWGAAANIIYDSIIHFFSSFLGFLQPWGNQNNSRRQLM